MKIKQETITIQRGTYNKILSLLLLDQMRSARLFPNQKNYLSPTIEDNIFDVVEIPKLKIIVIDYRLNK